LQLNIFVILRRPRSGRLEGRKVAPQNSPKVALRHAGA